MKFNRGNNFLRLTAGVLAALGALALPAVARAQTDTLRVSLDEVLSYAAKSSPQVRAAQSGAEAAEGQKMASLAGYLPHLKMNEMFARSNDPVFAFGSKLRQSIFNQNDFSLPALNQPSPLTNYSTRFVWEQPIFNGGQAFYGRRTASAYTEAAHSAAGFTVQETAFQVKQAYYSLILARASLKVIGAALEAAGSHQHQAERMVATGMATRADQLKASVRVAELEQKKISALNSVTVAGEYVKLASGMQDERPLAPVDSLGQPDLTAPVDSLVTFALDHQGQLAAADHAARAADYASRAALGAYIPHLNGFAQYEMDDSKLFGNSGDNWMVGVSLDWNFFDGLHNAGNAKSARAMREKARYEAALMRHKVTVDVREAWLNSHAAAEKIGVARKARAEATESLRIVENQYREGLATITDLLDTEAASTNAALNVSAALYEYNLALARLSLVTGGYDTHE